ncbi:hypothetical protein DFH01_10935 [Falsiroseomonas bella]|uniref:Uncharacterized protein n=2 Tax=Falsiroseomonas bella TaxID=2184016 RepID=A0A317FHD5_9PROT|nr:hypothetical protein DFH01_10935 [Falsiroseomonas bella]
MQPASRQPAGDTVRDALIATLLHEHAAVLEVAPTTCAGQTATTDGVIAGAGDALAAMQQVMGSGLVVAIGYGPGSTAMLDLLAAPLAGASGMEALQYAAAVALGDGAAAFALGGQAPRQDATARLGALCRALAGVAGGMGRTPERVIPASAAEACVTAMADGTPRGIRPIRVTEPR